MLQNKRNYYGCITVLGLPLSLLIGMQYGKYLSRTSKKPFIPIHHMEAHALTIRMVEKVSRTTYLYTTV